MVCGDCEEKLSKGIVPDKWQAGARNATGGAASSGGRFVPGSKACKICKQKTAQDAHYCQQCAFHHGICAMCGVKIADLRYARRGGADDGRKRKRVDDGSTAEAEAAPPAPPLWVPNLVLNCRL